MNYKSVMEQARIRSADMDDVDETGGFASPAKCGPLEQLLTSGALEKQ